VDPQVEKIMLLKVPLDIVPPKELPEVIFRLLSKDKNPEMAEKGMNIVLLSLWDLLRARRNKEYREYVFKASLVIPISKSLVTGAKFLTGKQVYRYMPFNFIISLLSILEKRELSLFLLGSNNRVLSKTEKNIRYTFPGLKIVGRYEGRIKKAERPAINEAIRKASPTLLLVGRKVRGGELWIARNTRNLNSTFRLWCSDLFEVFTGKKYRPSKAVFDKGLESVGYCIRNPFRFFRIFLYLYYKLLLLFYKLFKSR
jgi:N-acetylglucosaminyldiphosphoundecaprenol N-acetyl-beta-D-mannosaminyltransferase